MCQAERGGRKVEGRVEAQVASEKRCGRRRGGEGRRCAVEWFRHWRVCVCKEIVRKVLTAMILNPIARVR